MAMSLTIMMAAVDNVVDVVGRSSWGREGSLHAAMASSPPGAENLSGVFSIVGCDGCEDLLYFRRRFQVIDNVKSHGIAGCHRLTFCTDSECALFEGSSPSMTSCHFILFFSLQFKTILSCHVMECSAVCACCVHVCA